MKEISNTNRVTVHVDADPDIPDSGVDYMHCTRCLDEWTEMFQDITTPKEYARQQAAITETGAVQIRCVRHDLNVCVFTFQNEGSTR